MQNSRRFMLAICSCLGLFTTNFLVSLPAKANVVCQPGTINRFDNGQLESCVITSNIKVVAANHHAGNSAFVCRENSYIYFDESGKFQGCVLANTIRIKKGNAVEVCPETSMVYVANLNNSNQFLSCRQLSY